MFWICLVVAAIGLAFVMIAFTVWKAVEKKNNKEKSSSVVDDVVDIVIEIVDEVIK